MTRAHSPCYRIFAQIKKRFQTLLPFITKLGDEMPSPSRSDDELAMPEPCYFKIETYLESFVLEK